MLRAPLFSTATGEPVFASAPLCTELALVGAGGVAGEAPVAPVDGCCCCLVALSDSVGTGIFVVVGGSKCENLSVLAKNIARSSSVAGVLCADLIGGEGLNLRARRSVSLGEWLSSGVER